jgi:hypothetical protein
MAAMTTTETMAAEGSDTDRDIYELRQVTLDKEEQRKGLDAFLKEAAIPALNGLGIKPVGVFAPAEGFSPVYVLLRHPSMESIATLTPRMAEDGEFLSKGADFINAPASAPAFNRVESSIMIGFKGMPHLDTPVRNAGRVFQLRTYESPSFKTNLKKIEMFNDAGEIKLFREVGLQPVFFGQTIAGSKMPNLTYMLVAKDMDAQKAAWQKFGSHPEWKKLSQMPEYADKAILSHITNIQLVAADYSQI